MIHRFRILNPHVQLSHLTNWLTAHVGALVAEGPTHAWGHGWHVQYFIEPKEGWVWCFTVYVDGHITPEIITQFALTWS
jgi:hypothetical protein